MTQTNYRLEKLSDPDAEPLGPEPSLLNLCDEILAIVQDEGAIIGDVFPHPSTVIQVFLQRIFQQSVIISKVKTNPRSKVVLKV
jgi:hypothetical protein